MTCYLSLDTFRWSTEIVHPYPLLPYTHPTPITSTHPTPYHPTHPTPWTHLYMYLCLNLITVTGNIFTIFRT